MSQGTQIDVNTIVQKLSWQIADLISAKIILETENEILKKQLEEIMDSE